MENKKTSAKQIMLNYGLLLGFMGILINVVNYSFGNVYKPHWSIGVVSVVVTITIIILALKKTKENNGGYLSLGESIKTGLGISLIAAILGVIYTYLFTHFIEPEYFQRMLEFQMQTIADKYPNFSDEQIEASKKSMEMMSNPFITSAIAIIGSLFFGFIISLVGGLIMKKTDEEITSI